MNKYIAEYIEYAKRKKYRESTVAEYELFLKTFFGFITGNYPEVKEITSVTRDMIRLYEKYLVTMKDSRGKIMTRNRRRRYLANLKTFFNWLLREEKIYVNPASNVAIPREKVSLPGDILKPEEMNRLLKSATGTDLMTLRDRSILELLYSTGLRADELCNIEISDIDFDDEILFVRKGKKDNQRFVPFGESAKYWLMKYIEAGRGLYPGENKSLLYLTLRGRPLTPVTLGRIIKKYVEKAGIEKRICSHSFRHTCATLMLKNNADIRYVQELLGHKSISTTEKYLRVDITDLKEIHRKCHPREKE